MAEDGRGSKPRRPDGQAPRRTRPLAANSRAHRGIAWPVQGPDGPCDFGDPAEHAAGTVGVLDFGMGIKWSELEALSLWDPGTPGHARWIASARAAIAGLEVRLAAEA